jgi:hypothetical protein
MAPRESDHVAMGTTTEGTAMSTAEFFAYLAGRAATRDLANELQRIIEQRPSEPSKSFDLTSPRAA